MSLGLLGNLGRRVKTWREDHDVDEATVASAWGVHADELRRVEAGEARPPHSGLADYTGLARLMLAIERAFRVGAAVDAGEAIPGATQDHEVVSKRGELYLLLDAEREEWDEVKTTKAKADATASTDSPTW